MLLTTEMYNFLYRFLHGRIAQVRKLDAYGRARAENGNGESTSFLSKERFEPNNLR